MHLKSFTSFTSIKEIVRCKRIKQKAKRNEKNQKRSKSRKNKRNKEKRVEPKSQHEAQHQFLDEDSEEQVPDPYLAWNLANIAPETFAQPLPWRRPSHLDDAFHVNSAAFCHPGFETPPSSHPSPNPTRSSTLSSILSSSGTSLSSATSKIKFLFQRRHSDTGISRPSPLSRQSEKRNSVPGLSPNFPRHITEESRQDIVPSQAEGLIAKSVAPKQEPVRSARVMAQQSIDLKAARKRLKAWEPTLEAFRTIYESDVRPQLLQILEEINHAVDYTITVHNDNSCMTRVVVVTTSTELPADGKGNIQSHIASCFAESAELRVAVKFLEGNVKRTAGTFASSQDADNESKGPRNSGRHNERMLGDSVSFEDSDSAATLGPAISLGECDGWIVNWHLFHGIANWEQLHDPSKFPLHRLVHPACIDCRKNETPFRIGELQAYSGRMYRTTRQSRSLECFAAGTPGECKQNMQVVTDWAFCKAYKDEAQNCLRYAPPGIEVESLSEAIKGVFEQNPQREIIQTTGRSSGFRYAVVCETPADVRQYPDMPTREWYLQNLDGVLTSEEWNSEGPGVCGDSGAAVVHDETGKLLGQIWGRNVYDDDRQTPRITYFTHHWDIFDDIRERYPNLEGPFLVPKPKCHPSNNADVGDVAPGPSRMEADEKTLNPSRPRSRACSSTGGADGVVESFSQSTLAQSVTNSIGSGKGKAKKIYVGKALEGEMGCGQRDSSRNAARASVDDDTDVLVMRRSSAMVTA